MNPSALIRLLLLLPLTFLWAGCATKAVEGAPRRGDIASAETLKHFTRESIDAANKRPALTGPALCDVKVVQLTYHSIGVKGEPQVLSAGLYVPERCEGPFPLLAEAHGTEAEKQRLTTQLGPGNTTITYFAARGYVVVATDYLGLGKSDHPYHPYLHADSEASAIIDSIRAAKAAAGRLNVSLDDAVMLFGYSQGGHAAMAAQREIERHHRNEIRLVASAPMAGPYSLSQTFLGSWFGNTGGGANTLASPLLAYTIVSYNRIYGTLYTQPDQVFATEYASRVEGLFSGMLAITDIYRQQLLPPGDRLNDLRNPAFTANFLLDESQPFRKALRENDLLDWTPQTPMMLCGSRRDGIVDFFSTHAAQAAFRARGVDVPVVDIADEIPETADSMAHHTQFAHLCYGKAREQLFDPLAKRAASRAELTRVNKEGR